MLRSHSSDPHFVGLFVEQLGSAILASLFDAACHFMFSVKGYALRGQRAHLVINPSQGRKAVCYLGVIRAPVRRLEDGKGTLIVPDDKGQEDNKREQAYLS